MSPTVSTAPSGALSRLACAGLLVLPALLAAPAVAGAGCPCSADLDGNGAIDGADLGALLSAWGPCPNCPADLSGNGVVDGADLGILLSTWGPCFEPPANDQCADAKQIVFFTGSANPFCTIGATTQGSGAVGASCGGPVVDAITDDVWFRFTSPITGTLQVGVCGDFPVRIAVYGENTAGACECTGAGVPGPLVACSDTGAYPGCPSGAAVLVPAVAGDCFLLRVGGSAGGQGVGTVDINIYVPSCSVDSSTTLAASGLEASSQFGLQLDIDGDAAVVSAIFDDFDGLTNPGSARVYRRSGALWSPEATLTGPAPFGAQRFGVDVAIDGDWIVVGAGDVEAGCLADPDCDTGAAHVYRYDGRAWIYRQTLVADGSSPLDKYGTRVAIDGMRMLVAARDETNAGGERAGAVYAYRRIDSIFGPVWVFDEKLTASDAAEFDNFGSDVAVSGDWALIGADGVGASNSGAAYLFSRAGGAWAQVAKLVPPGLAGGANLGRAVALDGDLALVGAPEGAMNTGRVFVYERFGADTWLLATTLVASDGAAGDRFGQTLSLAGTQAVVGSPFAGGSQGKSHFFRRISGGWVERAILGAADGAPGHTFSAAGVFDGRALMGAYNNGVGTVYVFSGLNDCTGNGIVDTCDIAAGLPDSNGDGVPDICEP